MENNITSVNPLKDITEGQILIEKIEAKIDWYFEELNDLISFQYTINEN